MIDAPMWLYHVTSYATLDPIAARGLLPGGRSVLSSTIPSGHLEGVIFLTEADGLNFWYQRAEEAMVHVSDNAREEGYTPVVLRTPFVECDEDYLGTRDAGGALAYRCELELPAEELEYFDGKQWRPVDEWEELDTDQAWDEDGYFLAETPLQPEWRDLKENPESAGALNDWVYADYGLSRLEFREYPEIAALGIEMIAVSPDARGSGRARGAMEAIIKWSEATGTTLYLTPDALDDGGRRISTSRLKRFYRSLGFVKRPSGHGDFLVRDSMMREPGRTPNPGHERLKRKLMR